MGYRSDVTYVIRFKDKAQREQFEELVKHKGDEHMTQALGELSSQGRYLYGSFESVKWYDGYPDVDSHHKMMEYAREVFPEDTGWRFVRVGEEHEDITVDADDEIGDLWDVLNPSTTIQLNIPQGE